MAKGALQLTPWRVLVHAPSHRVHAGLPPRARRAAGGGDRHAQVLPSFQPVTRAASVRMHGTQPFRRVPLLPQVPGQAPAHHRPPLRRPRAARARVAHDARHVLAVRARGAQETAGLQDVQVWVGGARVGQAAAARVASLLPEPAPDPALPHSAAGARGGRRDRGLGPRRRPEQRRHGHAHHDATGHRRASTARDGARRPARRARDGARDGTFGERLDGGG